jgi:hypothetical protein
MSVFLCTSSYRSTFGLPEKLIVPEDASNALLGPWYAHTLFIGPQRYLHYMSSRTLLPVVIWLRERSTAETRMMSTLQELLLQIGAPPAAVEVEIDALMELFYGRASDRSRLASMRDQKFTAKRIVHSGRTSSPWDLTIDLAKMPSGALGYNTPFYETGLLLHSGGGPRSSSEGKS